MDEQNYKSVILYIDDEPKNLTSFKATFRKNYNIYVANSAAEGIEILENNPIQLVITDQRMPNMTGVEFLEKIVDKHPDITRIILTGYSDVEAIIQAINKGHVYKYITKPWRKDELQSTIDAALELHYLKSENYKLIKSLKKTNEELDRFVYSAAHDLRGPVASLSGLIYLAKQEEECAKVRDYITLQESIIQKMNLFVQEIIDFSKNSHLETQIETVDFQQVVENILDSYEFYENSQQIEKIVNITQSTTFSTDKTRLELILSNLISNAIRFSKPYFDESFIEIEISLEAKTNNALIIIKDNGLGISEDRLPHIFEMFYRAHDQRVGAGLGLFLVKEALQRIDGQVEVASALGKGTTFTITLRNWSVNPNTAQENGLN